MIVPGFHMKILRVREVVSDLSYKVENSGLKSLCADSRFPVLFSAGLPPLIQVKGSNI